jgi:hypothetical protein
MVNYNKVVRGVFKVFCKNEYTEVFLKRKGVHNDIRSKFRIGEDKLVKILKPYEVEKNGEVCYRNPFKYEEFVLFMVEHIITGGISIPEGIDYREDTQIKEGRTPDELSVEFKRKYSLKMPPGEIRSLIKKSRSTRIKEGAAEHFYVSPD